MKKRIFGKTGIKASEVGLGTWQLGTDWGEVTEEESLSVLNDAIDKGVTFIDTADVYGAGRSEMSIGKILKKRTEKLFVASKVGRWHHPGWPENFTLDNMRVQIENSLERLGLDTLDLVQLHCIPTDALQKGEVFDNLRVLKREGLIKNFGVSVETMEEAQLCMEQDGVVSLQIIFNVLRQKPINELFDAAKQSNTALIVRLPLASGLLAGKMTKDTKFDPTDHRNYNRDGQKFNVGETFAGLPFEKGVELVDEIKPLVPEGMTMAQMAIRWILDYDAVSVVIPGASSTKHVDSNVEASELPPLSSELHQKLSEYYEKEIASHIRGPY